MSPAQVQHDEAGRRFFVPLTDGDAAVLFYRPEGNVLNFYRTYVPPTAREKGLAEALVTAGFKYAEKEGLKVVPSCSYVAETFLSRHPEFQPLVEEA